MSAKTRTKVWNYGDEPTRVGHAAATQGERND